MSKDRAVKVTKNYRMFGRSAENRPLDIKKHRRLEQSMKRYGFLPCFPIVCYRDEKKQLIVKDGQHRLAIAETLGLPVYWIEETVDFDVAVINCCPQKWVLRDYAQKHATNGLKAYQEGLEFADEHGLPVGTAFSLLGGTTSFSNIEGAFTDGSFRVKDRSWASSVATLYVHMCGLAPVMKNARFIEACMRVCRVKDFDAKRLMQNAERCREKLVNYSTSDAYLDMLDQVYNFGRKSLFALKIEAMKAMRERNAAKAKQRNAKGQPLTAKSA